MSRNLLAAFVGLALILAPPLSFGAGAPAAKSGEAAAAAIRAEVQTFVKSYVAASNLADTNSMMEMISRKEGVTSAANGDISRGWEAIRAEADAIVGKEGSYKISMGTIDVMPLGAAHALAVAPVTLTIVTPSGTVQLPGAMTLVLEKSGGTWRIVHEHTSSEFQDTEPGED